MTKEIKYPEEIKAAWWEVNPHCAIIPCYNPGATLGEFCPYHKELFDFQVAIFKKEFIKKYSEEVDK